MQGKFGGVAMRGDNRKLGEDSRRRAVCAWSGPSVRERLPGSEQCLSSRYEWLVPARLNASEAQFSSGISYTSG